MDILLIGSVLGLTGLYINKDKKTHETLNNYKILIKMNYRLVIIFIIQIDIMK